MHECSWISWISWISECITIARQITLQGIANTGAVLWPYLNGKHYCTVWYIAIFCNTMHALLPYLMYTLLQKKCPSIWSSFPGDHGSLTLTYGKGHNIYYVLLPTVMSILSNGLWSNMQKTPFKIPCGSLAMLGLRENHKEFLNGVWIGFYYSQDHFTKFKWP